jgi:hypothetical protein
MMKAAIYYADTNQHTEKAILNADEIAERVSQVFYHNPDAAIMELRNLANGAIHGTVKDRTRKIIFSMKTIS